MSALGYDPVPGDVDAVQRVASTLGQVAGQAEIVTTRLAKLEHGLGPQIWRGPAADVFHSMLNEVGPEAKKLVDAHREAEDALRTYAGALGVAQGSARRAEHDAATAVADRDRAECERRRAAEEAATHRARVNECRLRIGQGRVARLTAIADPVYQAEMDRYENQVRGVQRHAEAGAAQAGSREAAARSAAAAAGARLEAARVLAREAEEIRDHAARRAVELMNAAGPNRTHVNPIRAFVGIATGTPLAIGKFVVGIPGIMKVLTPKAQLVGRYPKRWADFQKAVKRRGWPSQGLYYKRWPVTRWLKAAEPLRQAVERNPAIRQLALAATLDDIRGDLTSLHRSLRTGDHLGVAQHGLSAVGNGLKGAPGPKILYPFGVAASVWSDTFKHAATVDWNHMPSLADIRRYGPQSFVEAVGTVTKSAPGWL